MLEDFTKLKISQEQYFAEKLLIDEVVKWCKDNNEYSKEKIKHNFEIYDPKLIAKISAKLYEKRKKNEL